VTGSVSDSKGDTLLDVGGCIHLDRNVYMVADSYDEAFLFQGTISLAHGIAGDWAGVAPVSNPLELAKAAGCLACHAVDKKVVGPAWNDVAVRYKNADARSYLIEKVKTGGKGNWTEITGGVPMPPYYPRVPQYYIATLVDYIRSLGN
jgi:cytochrome c